MMLSNWALLLLLIVVLVIWSFFRAFDKRTVTSREVALIATMSTLAAVARVPFAVIAGVQPTTFIVMITGYVFGAQAGFIVGAIAALVSNIFLGQGPWTPWQMFSWGLAGVLGSFVAGKTREYRQGAFAIAALCYGYVFGWIINLWHWLGFVYPLNLQTFLAAYAVSFPFDTMHAVGNLIFALVFGRTFYTVLCRFRNKIRIVRMLPFHLL